jgi:hypothetical protein
MANPFAKASRQQQPVRFAITGPSGAGKTLGALVLARNLIGVDGKLAVIDTEAGSASLYADKVPGGFDAVNLRPPYLTRKYLEAIDAAITNDYEALVIDSITHQWDGEGGILQRKEQADQVPGSNQWTNWGPFTKEHNEFRSAILNCPIHLIVTLRSKMAYAQSEGGGKKKIEKLGMQPIQREGLEYEFTTTFDVSMAHRATAGGAAGKDRTGLFDGQVTDLCDPKTAARILDWLGTSEPPPPAPSPAQFAELESVAENEVYSPAESAAILKKARTITTQAAMSELIEKAIATVAERTAKLAGAGAS